VCKPQRIYLHQRRVAKELFRRKEDSNKEKIRTKRKSALFSQGAKSAATGNAKAKTPASRRRYKRKANRARVREKRGRFGMTNDACGWS
jgi:hypothetical protein